MAFSTSNKVVARGGGNPNGSGQNDYGGCSVMRSGAHSRGGGNPNGSGQNDYGGCSVMRR